MDESKPNAARIYEPSQKDPPAVHAENSTPHRPGVSSAMFAARAAQREADCASIEARADLSDFAKSSIKQEIRTGKLRAADVAKEVSA